MNISFPFDGPPFCSGEIHLGTIYNKNFKDFYVNYHNLRKKKKKFFKRGYDAQGAPNENKIRDALKIRNSNDIRDFGLEKFYILGDELINKNISKMESEFKSLNFSPEFFKEEPYFTSSKDFMKFAIDRVNDLVIKNKIKRQNKVIDYCETCETVVAISEIEYKDNKDLGFYIKFQTKNNYDLLIYTTNLWTLFCNQAIAYNSNLDYMMYTKGGKSIVAIKDCNLFDETYEKTIIKLNENLTYINCIGQEKNLINDFFVQHTGTGLVHIAPCHGEIDFEVASKRKIPINCKIKELEIACTNYNKNLKEKLKIFIFKEIDILHRVSICWRCKTILKKRNTAQYYIIFTKQIEKIVKKVEKLIINPLDAKKEIIKNLRGRTEWCISRQRFWGTSLPFWECNNCENWISKSTNQLEIQANNQNLFLDHFRLHNLEKLNFNCRNCDKKLTYCSNVLDVWGESGLVILFHNSLEKISKNYMLVEALDQRRGWFLSLIILSHLLKGKFYFDKILNHGFIMKDKINKMSKSQGDGRALAQILQKKENIANLKELLLSRPCTESLIFNFTDLNKSTVILKILKELKNFENYFF